MTKKPPPVPPANRSPKGPGGAPKTPVDDSKHRARPENQREQGNQGDIAQNATNQGYQQDR